MSAPSVTVVIPAKDVAAVLGEQLESLLAQVDAPAFEVVVADNGSSDDLAGVVASYADRLVIRVVDALARAGASYARNVGSSHGRGEVHLFCDADDLVGEHWVGQLTAAVLSRPRCVAAGTLLHDRFNDPAVLAAYGIGPDPQDVDHHLGRFGEAQEPFAGHLPTVPGGCFGIRGADYAAVGGMDSSYPGGSEETDFVWRAQEQGCPVVHAPAGTVQYRLRSTPRALFRQQRIQQLARVLLWVRWGERGMDGPSARASLTTAARHAVLLARARDRPARLRHARILGGHVGALQGMVRYRLLRRVPRPQIGDGLSPPPRPGP